MQTPTDIVVTANSSVKSSSPDVLLDLQLFAESAPDAWGDAVRFVTLAQEESWNSIAISHGTKLQPGKHVIEWYGRLNGGDVEFDGGSLSVVASAQQASQPAPTRREVASTQERRGTQTQGSNSASREQQLRGRPRDRQGVSETREQKSTSLPNRILRTKGQMEDMPQVRREAKSNQ